MAERDLNLRITADAEQATAEINKVQQAEQGLVTSTTETTAATSASAAAIRDQGQAAGESSDQVSDNSAVLGDMGSAATVAGLAQQKLQVATVAGTSAQTGMATATTAAAVAADAHVVAFQAEQAASAGVVAGLREVQASMAALSTVTEVGGAEMTAALGRTAIAIAAVKAEMLAAGGGTAAQEAALAGLEARYISLIPTLGRNTAATAASLDMHKLQTLGIQAAGKAVAGHELSVAKLTTSLLKFAAPALGMVTVFAILPQLIKLVVDKTSEWATSIGESIAGLDRQDGVIRKAGESTNDYQKRVNAAADANADLERATYAATAGVIAQSDDMSKQIALWHLHREALHQGSISAEQLAKDYKALGIAMGEGLKFEDAKSRVEAFITQYGVSLKQGENVSRRFADANKSNIKEWMEAYEDAGIAIPDRLLKIAKSHDILTHAQEIATKNTKELKEMQALADEDAKKFGITTEELSRIMLRYGSVVAAAAAGVLDLNPGFVKISTGALVAKGSVDALVDALHSLGEATTRVNDISDATFDVGEEGGYE